ncbi:hypothetical protein EIP91_009690 [Steccherinum ochraceum]|uniref:Dienelactone hydrolase domain-containing protein n=1 Tax=Steccherinum ochraceum TaxID=92696 RepID=A0A4R0RNY7_9APHY|nr:hypothetical protein EIP91_009690 [Steccherinum ochraceum]
MATTRLRALFNHLNAGKTSTVSTMSTTVHNTNEACCTRPPVVSNYTPKGTYTSYGGFKKVYVTGPANRGDTVLVCVYDVFGFKPQTQQGADILAAQLNIQILMPDFFEDGAAWLLSQYPPKTDEQKANIQKFFGGIASPPNNAAKLFAFGEALRKDGAKKVGCYGFCWGGKVIMLAAGRPNTPFDVISIVHPAMLSSGDAENVNIPLGIFCSTEESADEFHKIVEIMSKKPFASKNDSRIFQSFHGFAAARSNLDDPDNKAKYEDLYQTLVKYFKNNGISA